MPKPDLRVFPDAAALYCAAAEAIAGALRARLESKLKATLVLSGGNTPKEVYRLLAATRYVVEWERVEFFWGDERCVPPSSVDSNFRMAQETLLANLEVPQDHVHRIRGELPDSEEAARLYEDEIRSAFAEAGVPRLDIVVLGMGTDGHTASLFPATHWDENRLVITNEAPIPPRRRISMTPRLLNAAEHVFFLVSGPGKASALKKVLDDPSCDCPARRIQPTNGTLTWMVDSAAAALSCRQH